MKSSLRISLKSGEKIFINGAVLRVDRKVSLEFMNDVTFLLENHVLQPEDASTPLRQLYFIAQMMLINPEGADQSMIMFKKSVMMLLNCFGDITLASFSTTVEPTPVVSLSGTDEISTAVRTALADADAALSNGDSDRDAGRFREQDRQVRIIAEQGGRLAEPDDQHGQDQPGHDHEHPDPELHHTFIHGTFSLGWAEGGTRITRPRRAGRPARCPRGRRRRCAPPPRPGRRAAGGSEPAAARRRRGSRSPSRR